MVDKDITIVLSGNLGTNLFSSSAKFAQEECGVTANFEFDLTESVEVENMFSIETTTGIASLLGVIYKVVENLFRYLQNKKWTEKYFLEVIDAEMKKREISNYAISNIDNFGCLIGQGSCPCEVLIFSKEKPEGYKIIIARKKRIFTFRLESISG